MQQQNITRWHPHVTVATIVVKDNQYLMVKESPAGKPVLNQPAGHVEQGESIVDAAIRETLEETGWQVNPEFLVGLYHYNTPIGITYLRFTFFATPVKHNPHQQLDSVIEEVVWLDREALCAARDRLRGEIVLRCIDDFEQGKQFPLDTIPELKQFS